MDLHLDNKFVRLNHVRKAFEPRVSELLTADMVAEIVTDFLAKHEYPKNMQSLEFFLQALAVRRNPIGFKSFLYFLHRNHVIVVDLHNHDVHQKSIVSASDMFLIAW